MINDIYKAKSLYTGKWLEGYFQNGYMICQNEKNLNKPKLHKVIPGTLCRFTNRLDTNGRRIFDGDKLGCKTPKAVFMDVVVYDAETGDFRGKEYGPHVLAPLRKPYEVRVIGNIHDK